MPKRGKKPIATVVKDAASRLSPRSRRTRSALEEAPADTQYEANPVARNLGTQFQTPRDRPAPRPLPTQSPREYFEGLKRSPGAVPVGRQRTDTASADAVISDRVPGGTDWNTQFEQTRGVVAREADGMRGAVRASQAEVLAGVKAGTARTGINIVESERRTTDFVQGRADEISEEVGDLRTATTEGFAATADALRAGLEGVNTAVGNAADRTARAIGEAQAYASEDARRTRQAIGDALGDVSDAVDDMNRVGSRERATIINELQQQSGDLTAVVDTLGRIEAQGRALPPDALEAATRAIEQEPEIQRLVNDGLLKWQDLLGANGQLDMAAVARVRTMLQQQQVRKENEVQSAYAMFNRIETQPGRKSLGAGQSLWFPAMWSNTIRA